MIWIINSLLKVSIIKTLTFSDVHYSDPRCIWMVVQIMICKLIPFVYQNTIWIANMWKHDFDLSGTQMVQLFECPVSTVIALWLFLIFSCLLFRCYPHIGHIKTQLVRYLDPALIKGLIFVYFKGLDGGNGGTSSPFNPAMAAPSPSAVAQSGSSMAHIEQIRQVRNHS